MNILVSCCSLYWQGRRDRHEGTYRGECVPENARVHYDRGWCDGRYHDDHQEVVAR